MFTLEQVGTKKEILKAKKKSIKLHDSIQNRRKSAKIFIEVASIIMWIALNYAVLSSYDMMWNEHIVLQVITVSVSILALTIFSLFVFIGIDSAFEWFHEWFHKHRVVNHNYKHRLKPEAFEPLNEKQLDCFLKKAEQCSAVNDYRIAVINEKRCFLQRDFEVIVEIESAYNHAERVAKLKAMRPTVHPIYQLEKSEPAIQEQTVAELHAEIDEALDELVADTEAYNAEASEIHSDIDPALDELESDLENGDPSVKNYNPQDELDEFLDFLDKYEPDDEEFDLGLEDDIWSSESPDSPENTAYEASKKKIKEDNAARRKLTLPQGPSKVTILKAN